MTRLKSRFEKVEVGLFVALIGFVSLGTYVVPKAYRFAVTPALMGNIEPDMWFRMIAASTVFLVIGIVGTVIYSRHRED